MKPNGIERPGAVTVRTRGKGAAAFTTDRSQIASRCMTCWDQARKPSFGVAGRVFVMLFLRVVQQDGLADMFRLSRKGVGMRRGRGVGVCYRPSPTRVLSARMGLSWGPSRCQDRVGRRRDGVLTELTATGAPGTTGSRVGARWRLSARPDPSSYLLCLFTAVTWLKNQQQNTNTNNNDPRSRLSACLNCR